METTFASPPLFSLPKFKIAVAESEMEYFVSIENTRYMRWQIRLLQESMKLLGIEDKLLVAWAESPEEQPEPISGRNFRHANIGYKLRYQPVNKPFALMHAINNGLIKQPFTVIDPDMVFRKPISVKQAPIAAQYCWHMELDYWEQKANWHFLKDMGLEDLRASWHPVGYIYQFNDAPNSIFEEMYHACIDLVSMYQPGDGKLSSEQYYWVREMIAFAIPLAGKQVDIVTDFQTALDRKSSPEASATDSPDACLIHYWKSYRPYFDKRKLYGTDDSPYDAIMSIPPENDLVKHMRLITERVINGTSRE